MERASETTPVVNDAVSVFVSYSRDDRPAALPIIEGLEAEGFKVWWDGLLEGGDTFANATETALELAQAVVVLWSARSVQSHWVRDEATRGRDRGCMVPFRSTAQSRRWASARFKSSTSPIGTATRVRCNSLFWSKPSEPQRLLRVTN